MTARNLNLRSSLSTLAIAFAAITGAAACDLNGDTDPRKLTGADEATTDTDGDDGEGCTLTQGYWKNHQPWPVADADAVLCGETWDDILHTPPKGDAWYILAHQWIAASLNVAAGADVTPDVQAALDAAEGFLADCEVSKAEKSAALAASSLLDDYNNGAVGPGHCGDNDSGGDTGGDATTGDATTGDATTGDTTTGDATTGDCLAGCDESGTTGWPIPQ